MAKKPARELVPGDVLLEPSREEAGTVIHILPISETEMRVLVDSPGPIVLDPSEIIETR